MLDGLSRTLREIQGGAVARLVLADILKLAEGEGILGWVRKLSPFSPDDLCAALQSHLGYALGTENRRRMIRLLLGLLDECGRVEKAGGTWRWTGDGSPFVARAGRRMPPPEEEASATMDAQYVFFRRCLDAVPTYLRGGEASFRFDDQHAGAWERFLGCAEFCSCRSLLLEFLGIDAHPTPRILDLCHGPGWGLAAVLARFPAARLTALDFTDAFRQKAQARAEAAQERYRRDGHAVAPVVWLGPDSWGGFGQPLPLPDGAFDGVVFTCGDPYIPRGLRGSVYRDIARVLAPDGRLGVLTRSCPDVGTRHAPSFWLRVSALAHDFAESVCEGWEGFSTAEENARMFVDAGFHGGVALPYGMSLFESSLWILRTTRTDV
jgi:SAM-dependent methyltransferase